MLPLTEQGRSERRKDSPEGVAKQKGFPRGAARSPWEALSFEICKNKNREGMPRVFCESLSQTARCNSPGVTPLEEPRPVKRFSTILTGVAGVNMLGHV